MVPHRLETTSGGNGCYMPNIVHLWGPNRSYSSHKEREELGNKFRSLAAPKSLRKLSPLITNYTRVRSWSAFQWCRMVWSQGDHLSCPGELGGGTACSGGNTVQLLRARALLWKAGLNPGSVSHEPCDLRKFTYPHQCLFLMCKTWIIPTLQGVMYWWKR